MTGGGLIVESIRVRRGGRSVLEPLSFRLTAGDTLAVIGPNGAGKTSLLEAVLGFLPLQSGRVSYGGRPLHSLRERARVFSFLAEDAEPPAEVRVGALLRLAARQAGARQRLTEALVARLGLKGLATALAGELSRGEKRRVLLFGALCTDRPVIVLDEPLGVFDPLQMIDIRALLRERAGAGTALLLSVHQMAEAERIATRFLLLDNGRGVALGSLAELRAQIEQADAPLEDIFLTLLRRGGADVAA